MIASPCVRSMGRALAESTSVDVEVEVLAQGLVPPTASLLRDTSSSVEGRFTHAAPAVTFDCSTKQATSAKARDWSQFAVAFPEFFTILKC